MILELLHAAAAGSFPPEDGRTDVVAAAAGAPAAVLSFTAHHVVAVDLPPDEVLARIDPRDLKGPLAPGALTWLAGRTGLVAGSLDVLMAWVPGRAAGDGLPVREIEAREHPRVDRALRWRRELRVYEEAAGRGMVLLGRGVADRLELSVEVEPAERDRGLARRLVTGALAAAAPGEPVFAQVAAANAASLRALGAAGFVPIGAEVLFGPLEDFFRRSADGVVAAG